MCTGDIRSDAWNIHNKANTYTRNQIIGIKSGIVRRWNKSDKRKMNERMYKNQWIKIGNTSYKHKYQIHCKKRQCNQCTHIHLLFMWFLSVLKMIIFDFYTLAVFISKLPQSRMHSPQHEPGSKNTVYFGIKPIKIIHKKNIGNQSKK